MKKIEITDDTGKITKVDIKKFKKHIDEYHLNGSSLHEEWRWKVASLITIDILMSLSPSGAAMDTF